MKNRIKFSLLLLSLSGWIASSVVLYGYYVNKTTYDKIYLDEPFNIVSIYLKDKKTPEDIFIEVSTIVNEKRSFAQQGSLKTLCEKKPSVLSDFGGGMLSSEISNICSLVVQSSKVRS